MFSGKKPQTMRQLEAREKKRARYYHIFPGVCSSTDGFSTDTLLTGSALCVTEEIGWWRRSVCFQYDPWRENSLWADITPNCDSRGQTGEATHTSQPSPDTCPAPVDLSHVHTQTHHIHVSAYSHTRRSLKPQAIDTIQKLEEVYGSWYISVINSSFLRRLAFYTGWLTCLWMSERSTHRQGYLLLSGISDHSQFNHFVWDGISQFEHVAACSLDD